MKFTKDPASKLGGTSGETEMIGTEGVVSGSKISPYLKGGAIGAGGVVLVGATAKGIAYVVRGKKGKSRRWIGEGSS